MNVMTNETFSAMGPMNLTSQVDAFQQESLSSDLIFGRHEFVQSNPWLAFPTVLVLFAASVIGTFGNILILLAVLTCKDVRTVESTFIVNLAFSDLYVTVIADPMSIVGKCTLLIHN